MITFGPCQTPTLGFCIRRDNEIKNFKPKAFYKIVPTIILKSKQTYDLNWEMGKIFDLN